MQHTAYPYFLIASCAQKLLARVEACLRRQPTSAASCHLQQIRLKCSSGWQSIGLFCQAAAHPDDLYAQAMRQSYTTISSTANIQVQQALLLYLINQQHEFHFMQAAGTATLALKKLAHNNESHKTQGLPILYITIHKPTLHQNHCSHRSHLLAETCAHKPHILI